MKVQIALIGLKSQSVETTWRNKYALKQILYEIPVCENHPVEQIHSEEKFV